jgi:hypothetical protein
VSGRFVDAPVALVLLVLALVLHPLALVGIAVPPVRVIVAAVRESVPLVGGGIAQVRGPVGDCGAALSLGVLLLDLGGVRVPLQRPAVELGGAAMEIDERGLGGLGHQALAALRGLALATGVLARSVAVRLRPPRKLAMVVGGHDRKVLRTVAIRHGSYERVVL